MNLIITLISFLIWITGFIVLIAYGMYKVDIFINKNDEEIVYGSVDTKLNLLISANSLLWTPVLFYIIRYILYRKL